MALLIAQPMSMENSVSKNSYFSCLLIIFSSFKFHWRLWMISECRKRLCGITTAPNTLMTINIEFSGKLGVTQPTRAEFQLISTNDNSYKNDNPMIETKPIIHFSITRYEFVKSMMSTKYRHQNSSCSNGDIEKHVQGNASAQNFGQRSRYRCQHSRTQYKLGVNRFQMNSSSLR